MTEEELISWADKVREEEEGCGLSDCLVYIVIQAFKKGQAVEGDK